MKKVWWLLFLGVVILNMYRRLIPRVVESGAPERITLSDGTGRKVVIQGARRDWAKGAIVEFQIDGTPIGPTPTATIDAEHIDPYDHPNYIWNKGTRRRIVYVQ